jgi:hypothetical protein
LFGPVTVGDCFDFRGLIMYRLGEGDLFTDIKVAYNSFTFTGTDGTVRELGAPTDALAARLPPDRPVAAPPLAPRHS